MNITVLGKLVDASDDDAPDDTYLVRCSCGDKGFVHAGAVMSGSITACPTCAQMENNHDLPRTTH